MAIDLIGQRFSKLVVIKRDFSGTPSVHARWVCQCDCGNIISVLATNLKKQHGTKSCGCYKKEMWQNMVTKHGLYYTTEHSVYQNMLGRCYNKNNQDYYNYGGRNIKVDETWLGEYGLEQFIVDMGMKPFEDASLDRIDNNIGYSKTNCRWIHKSEQARNRTCNKIEDLQHANSIRLEYANGKTIRTLAEENMCSYKCIHAIIKNETWN